VIVRGDDHRKTASDTLDRFYAERDDHRHQLAALADPVLAGRITELDGALHDYDEIDKQLRALGNKASKERAGALLGTEARASTRPRRC